MESRSAVSIVDVVWIEPSSIPSSAMVWAIAGDAHAEHETSRFGLLDEDVDIRIRKVVRIDPNHLARRRSHLAELRILKRGH